MYYYILEQPKSMLEKSLQKQFRDIVGFFGIAGEITQESPARNVDELVKIALDKEYNTIVVMGSDKLINKVASLICNKNITLGIIPVNASPIIEEIFSLPNNKIEIACQALKQRYLKIVDLAYLYPSCYFLTSAIIKSSHPLDISLQVDDFKTQIKMTELKITSAAINTLPTKNNDDIEQSDNRLHLFFTNSQDQPGNWQKAFNWAAGKKTLDKISSAFRARKIIIESVAPIPVYLDNQIIDKTPVMFVNKPRALKIIKSRAKILEK